MLSLPHSRRRSIAYICKRITLMHSTCPSYPGTFAKRLMMKIVADLLVHLFGLLQSLPLALGRCRDSYTRLSDGLGSPTERYSTGFSPPFRSEYEANAWTRSWQSVKEWWRRTVLGQPDETRQPSGYLTLIPLNGKPSPAPLDSVAALTLTSTNRAQPNADPYPYSPSLTSFTYLRMLIIALSD